MREKGGDDDEATQFITRMLERFNQSDVAAVHNPFVVSQDLTPNESHKPMTDKRLYRDLVGSLLYVENATRPDINIAMSILS